MKGPSRQQKRFKQYNDRGVPIEDLQSLILDDDPPSDLQEDHVASRQHDRDLIAPVSYKAHQRVERNRRAAGVRRQREKSLVKRTIQRLRSSAVFKELEAEAMARWADDLEKHLQKSKA
jgi:hypothetical protein